jgi:hypothetical protein
MTHQMETFVDGARASAFFYSLIETAKANGLEPYSYLNYIFEELPKCKSEQDFEKLLPMFGIRLFNRILH